MPVLFKNKAMPMEEAMRDKHCTDMIGAVLSHRDWDFILRGEPVLPVKARREIVRAANKIVFFR